MLPATTSLERNDIGGSPRDRFVVAMHKAIDPVGEARNDFDIFRDLARRFGCEDVFAEGRDEAAWLHHLYDNFRERAQSNLVPEFDAFWGKGWVEIPPRADEYVVFADFRADPEKHKLRTPSGRIELYSDEIAGFDYDDCPPHPAWIEPAEWLGGRTAARFPLHLVSSQPRHKLHSQIHSRGKATLALRAAGLLAGLAGNQPADTGADIRALTLVVNFARSSARWRVDKPGPPLLYRINQPNTRNKAPQSQPRLVAGARL